MKVKGWLGGTVLALALAHGAWAQNYNIRVGLPNPALTLGTNSPSLFEDATGALIVSSYGSSSPVPYQYSPVSGTQSALAVTSATALTVPNGALFAQVTISSGGNVAFSLNSDYTPTATQTANNITYGTPLWIAGASMLSAAKFIDVTGSTATVFVQYFK